MSDAGVKRAIAFVTSGFSMLLRLSAVSGKHRRGAVQPLGDCAPVVDKIRVFFNHPGFVGPMARNGSRQTALDALGASGPQIPVLFTAHSIPLSMADTSRYVPAAHRSLRDSSRSMPAATSWRLPSTRAAAARRRSRGSTRTSAMRIRELAGRGVREIVVIAPIGFISDHMEVL